MVANRVHIFVAAANLLCTFTQAQTIKSTDLYPIEIQSIQGDHSSDDLSVLKSKDLTDTETNFDLSIQFYPEDDPKYNGIIFFDPFDSDGFTITGVELEGNVKLSSTSNAVWTLYIHNFVTDTWKQIDSGTSKLEGQWSIWEKAYLSFPPLYNSYISPSKQIEIMIDYNTDDSMIDIDFMKINVAFGPKKVLASDGEWNDKFGHSVAISGDTFVVGAYQKDIGADWDIGAVYIFSRNGNLSSKITPFDGEINDWFGKSVAISASYVVVGAHDSAYVFSLDGILQSKIVQEGGWFGWSVAVAGEFVSIGAPHDTTGSAYIFTTGGNLVRALEAPDLSSGADFGQDIDMTEDFVIVGAELDTDTGSAHIFAINGDFVTKIVPSDVQANGRFGSDVAIFGNTIVVGAEFDNHGSAYIYSFDGTLATLKKKIVAPDGGGNQRFLFGANVAVTETNVVIGATDGQQNGGISNGVYLFNTDGDFLEKLIPPLNTAGNDYFGSDVSISGGKLLIGAPYDDDTTFNSGAAYLYDVFM